MAKYGRSRLICLAVAVALGGCGKDVGDSEDGSIFGFSGEWLLLPGSAPVAEPCEVTLRDSTGSASCSGQKVEEYDGGDERYTTKIDLDADSTLTETRVSVSGTWRVESTDEYDGDVERRGCTLVFSGSAGRDEGRQSDGRLSALAGLWTGSATATATCWNGTPEQTRQPERFDFTFTADIFGTAAEIRWRSLGSLFDELVVVRHTDGQGLDISGASVPEGTLADRPFGLTARDP